jgi:hypothetical protein
MAKKPNDKKKPQNDDTPATNPGSLSDIFKNMAGVKCEVIDITPEKPPQKKPTKHTERDYGDEDDYMRALAERELPKDSPEIETALQLVSNVDYVSFLAATTVEETWRDKMPADRVDYMTTSCLLMGAENLNDILPQFEDETIDTVLAYDELCDALGDLSRTPPAAAYAKFDGDAHRLLLAHQFAGLSAATHALEQGNNLVLDKRAFAETAAIIILQSKLVVDAPPKPSDRPAHEADRQLIFATAKLFNEVTEKTGIPLTLTRAENGVYSASKAINNNTPKKPLPPGGNLNF